ncbi:M20/M25/M40 family metallo-hydrolase [Pedobacter gandavensis]|uniref:M20/M25/M40 family metallo-hydrolase n=1 Tax=Pedobacter gandavensis TaxID=2679963 RepID=A0ABR6EXT4_9SPHI|nr:M20/M25/M40 family metallo-hydrolase [Pedobacter gandavensis]MBB2150064.1 M20/M25/M40 family metallo-hydrolase [Pedobacter gandavensis]
MKKTIYTLLVVFLAQQAFAQDIDKIITRPYVERLIKTLSSDEMEGRATYSPGIDKAANFIAAEFKSIGLKPLEGNGYRQTFTKKKLKPVSTQVSIDGKDIPAENILVYGNTAETQVFDQSNSAGWIKLDPAKPFNAQLRALTKENKKQLVLVDPKFADVFKRIREYLAQGAELDEKKSDNGSTAFVLVLGVDTVAKDFRVNLKNKLETLTLFNVAGVIPGKSKAKEFVVFSGHYDHLGIIKSGDTDSIANGADDDASGTTAVIALAKYYKKLNNNERTLIFVAFTAEEIGGFGAKHFSEKLNPDEVVAMFNIEMIGKDSKFGKNTAFITGYDKSDFGKILQKNLEGTEFTFHPDPYPQQNLFYRSDNATLAALGVPAHTISTDQIDSDKYYHTVKDEFETLDVDNILSTIKGIAKSANSIIKGTDTPTRIPKLSN